MTDALHDDNLHFMISIWPNMSEACENYKEFWMRGFCCLQPTYMTHLTKREECFTGNRQKKDFFSMELTHGGATPASLLHLNGRII